MTSLLLALARVPGPLVAGLFATIGSWGLAMAVMTDCTNRYSCSTGTCEPCVATNAVLIGAWAVQGALFVLAAGLWLPAVVRRLPRRTLVLLALSAPLVSVLMFAGTEWLSDRTYCRPGQDPGGYEDLCDVHP